MIKINGTIIKNINSTSNSIVVELEVGGETVQVLVESATGLPSDIGVSVDVVSNISTLSSPSNLTVNEV